MVVVVWYFVCGGGMSVDGYWGKRFEGLCLVCGEEVMVVGVCRLVSWMMG